MSKLDEQEQLQERVVFASDAFRQPSSCDCKNLRKQPALNVWIEAMGATRRRLLLTVKPEVLLERELREHECDLIVASPLQVIERVDARFAHNRMILGLCRDISGRQCDV